ncbi:Zn(II)2Cys6 transcription factor [Aspergillus puulaauensis]|uniref:Zn(2)-C6 fungal-type domain-containing protein n=1 Tax=Aspergillus puulaauensis TaxID=1220207 RepID=A0A7R7XYV2_9EURO|nr:uncharacterized protein APUU_80367A [Aspergillus puulaauensis]BCS30064.1 hypothetical protein APUU_80367A [Aspergillus puulaauensis]
MPRNACTGCRSRKVRCVPSETGSKCKRCQARNLICSYDQPMTVSSFQRSSRDDAPRSSASSDRDTNAHWGLQLSSSNSGLDIGTGTPSELLREAELTRTLLLLYFQNFNDIHFMFDQTIFLRRYVLGDIPKVLLFAIMALGIRYSHAPFQSVHMRPHWGEPLYHQARQLLKEDFDRPSLTTIQAYVLLASYDLTFGGARKAWIYLSFARTFIGILKLDQPATDMDPVQAELCRRLIATIILMENTFPQYLNMGQYSLPLRPMPRLYSEEEFDIIKNTTVAPPRLQPTPCIAQEILTLSELYYEACQLFGTSNIERRNTLENKLFEWQANLHESFVFNQGNLEDHQKFSIRPFAYMHLLYTHIWQIILFHSMDWASGALFLSPDAYKSILPIYEHASTIANIVHQLWTVAEIDIHNPCFGQIVKTAQVVLAHRLLTTADPRIMVILQTQILVLRDCLVRVKAYCRLYNLVVSQYEKYPHNHIFTIPQFDQAEWFLRICTQEDFPYDKQQWQSMLRFQVMSLATSFERLDYETACSSSGLESLATAESREQHRRNQLPPILSPIYIARRGGPPSGFGSR